MSVASGVGPQRAEDFAFALSTRYAPFAKWDGVVDVDLLAELKGERTWRTAEEIAAARAADALPLAGLHLALDPGHIGGRWAETEGRHFKIDSQDAPVREGELVLEVAQRVRDALVELGAEVTLLREANVPVNPKGPIDYLQLASQQVKPPEESNWRAWWEYALAVKVRAIRLAVVTGDLVERARVVNQEVQPDALVSLHINAAPWPTAVAPKVEGGELKFEAEGKAVGEGGESAMCHPPIDLKPKLRLVRSNHLHVLIFGCLSDRELRSGRQQEQLATKLLNGSGLEELALGSVLADALAAATNLPAAVYDGQNAVRVDEQNPYVLARNLMLLRMVECPVVLLEPYVANSEAVYPRIQSALSNRAAGASLADDDILLEYADAVVAGVVRRYAADKGER